VIASEGGNGYFHWLFDVLPRFELLEGYPVDAFYVENSQSYHHQYLQLVGIDENRIISAEKATHIRAQTLVIPSLPGTSGNISGRACRFLRRLMDKALRLPLDTPIYERIYISRRDAKRRRVLNEDEVFDVLKAYGFVSLDLTGRSVIEQIRLFAHARHVVAPHGAGLSNLVYAQPGTTVLELFSPAYINPCYWTLANELDLRYHYVLGEGESYDLSTYPHDRNRDMIIDPKRLSWAISRILTNI
ncbi:MAG: glycosyltransferase family 61 protein, partial [Anaerolineae bacterium]|nr:glycosyltransferase family 61 protein [Anaerolineae bacterium]